MNPVTRPVMRYHGGKNRIAPRIIAQFPPHRIYVEPYCGAASVLMKKERSFSEVINDLDGEVVNVFRVLRDREQAARLRELLELTPWARAEFELCYQPSDDPVEQARRTIARGFMAHGSTARRLNRTGFRSKNYRRNQTGAGDWKSYPAAVPAFVERLQGVTIERRPALEIIAQQDSPETLFYCDPPYVHATRTALEHKGGPNDCCYQHEMSDADHRDLARALGDVAGMVVLSGYHSALYEELYGGGGGSGWNCRRAPTAGWRAPSACGSTRRRCAPAGRSWRRAETRSDLSTSGRAFCPSPSLVAAPAARSARRRG